MDKQAKPDSWRMPETSPPYFQEVDCSTLHQSDAQQPLFTMPSAPSHPSTGAERQQPFKSEFREQPPSYFQDGGDNSEYKPLRQNASGTSPDKAPATASTAQPNLTQINIGQPPVTAPYIPGSCPVCHNTIWKTSYPCCAWFLCCFFFPSGLLCCLCMQQKRCTVCGLTMKSSPSTWSIICAIIFIILWVLAYVLLQLRAGTY